MVRHPAELATSDYFRSTKMDSQSSGPTFSAECDGAIGTACAVPALLTISIVCHPAVKPGFAVDDVVNDRRKRVRVNLVVHTFLSR
jgi:hypothetical protein